MGGKAMNELLLRRRVAAKSIPSVLNYVQSGLVAIWDGIENAGVGVHDNNASSWKDLSGNNRNWVLESGASWADNAFVTLPTMGFAARFSPAIAYSSIITQEIVLEVFDFEDNTRNDFFKFGTTVDRNVGGNRRYYMMRGLAYSRDSYYGWMPKHSSCMAVSDSTPPINTPQSIVTVYATGTSQSTNPQKFLINNVSKTGWQAVGWSDGDSPYISRDNIGFYGKVYAIRLYNRALTTAELTQNYELDKIRFRLNI